MGDFKFVKGVDYILIDGKIVLTEVYLMKRGACCGSGCKNCCYDPSATKGNRVLRKDVKKDLDK